MGTRPSEIYDVEDAFEAFCFDRAVITFGLAVEHALHGVEGKNAKEIERKQARELDKWLGRKQQFRDPAALKKKG